MSAFKYFSAFILSLLFTCFTVKAQQEHFVYLQTENQKPFYARLDNKVISSTSSGYLILPKMQEGRYVITIGFAGQEYPEEKFSVQVSEKNEGYLLKQLNDETFSLFNLQTLAILNPLKGEGGEATVVQTEKDDAFTKMLAKATKDPNLLQKEEKVVPVKSAEVKEAEVATNAEQSSVTVHNGEQIEKKANEEKQSQIIVSTEKNVAESEQGSGKVVAIEEGEVSEGATAAVEESSAKNNEIKRILNVQGRDGKEMIYIDESGKKPDTVRVFMPQTEPVREQGEIKSVITLRNEAPKAQMNGREEQNELPYTITPTVTAPKEAPKKQSVIIYEDKPAKGEDQLVVMEGAKKEEVKKEDGLIILPPSGKGAVVSDCKNIAGDKEFLRTRRRIAAERTKEAMVEAARKAFKSTCYSVEQLRNLSFLFLDDESRYMFFDAAFGHASDPERFETLEAQLHDEYYINRFKAMIQK